MNLPRPCSINGNQFAPFIQNAALRRVVLCVRGREAKLIGRIGAQGSEDEHWKHCSIFRPRGPVFVLLRTFPVRRALLCEGFRAFDKVVAIAHRLYRRVVGQHRFLQSRLV